MFSANVDKIIEQNRKNRATAVQCFGGIITNDSLYLQAERRMETGIKAYETYTLR